MLTSVISAMLAPQLSHPDMADVVDEVEAVTTEYSLVPASLTIHVEQQTVKEQVI